jgi:L-lactate dehydrogenase (cytochrome)
MSLADCLNVGDFRRLARRRLPAPVFHYLEGGADDEWTLERNTAAFSGYELMPAYLQDVRAIDLTTRLLGRTQSMPLVLSPTGMSRLFHRDKELAVVRAASRHEVAFALSTMSTTSLEEVAATASGPRMFQVYVFKDRELTREFVDRCKLSRYDALCLTVDTPVLGNRERDIVYGMTVPPRFRPGRLRHFLARPGWSVDLLRRPDFRLANVEHRVNGGGGSQAVRLIDYIRQQFDSGVTWKDVEWLRSLWDGPLVIKGVQSAQDARRAVDAGATAIMISNHGGRQLDATPAPVDCIAEMRAAVGSGIELIVDGGIRRGTHVLKALALGANACSIGRPYLYGLAAGGQAGVERVLKLLRQELERDMALLGCRRIEEVTSDKVRRVGHPACSC